jgi:hypothetical protein
VDSSRKHLRRREQAAALLIVLALVVLATGLTVAYFSRTTADRPVANSSFNQAAADQLAQSATDSIIGDLQQEIIDGSVSPAPTFGPSGIPGPFHLYVPATTSNVIPVRNPAATPGTTPAIPNLIRRSVSSDAIPSPARPSRASAVNSMADVSANGRSVTLARWNSHYLIPKAHTGDDKTDPITTGFNSPNFWAPDWVYATAEYGADVLSTPTSDSNGRAVTPIGRYAYAIYDEGGLLNMNAAGFPSSTSVLQYGRKGSLAFADLSALGSYGLSSTGINNIVGLRNYASALASGSFSNLSLAPDANTYYNFVLSDPNYIKLVGPPYYSPIFFLTTAWQAPPQSNNNVQTDHAFVTRRDLIGCGAAVRSVDSAAFNANALQYVSTFSREALASAPQWSPTAPDFVNPNFQTLLVTEQFTRNDGTSAYVGDYLVNQRFLLQRLNWLTYKGPSATVANGGTRNQVPGSAPAVGSTDYDLWLLTRSNGITFGLTDAFLQKGTAANILKYFGLVWDSTNERWNYVGGANPNPSATPATSIATLNTLTGTREPDFFELLQAAILDNSLGDYYSVDSTLFPTVHQQSKMLHILTIGANLIAQSRVDSYPVRIACTVDVGSGNLKVMEAVGAPRLPYLNSLAACPVAGTATSGSPTGGVNWLLVPNLWDPYRDTWDLTEEHASNSTNGQNTIWLTPGYLRPPVRITVTGSVGLGTILASPSVQTGIVSSALVSPSPSPTTVVTISPPKSLPLTTPAASPGRGRNGFLEASRLSTSDVTPTPSPFTTTTSVSSAIAEWVNVPYPSPTANPTPVGTNVVFRISFPGTSIPDGWISPSQNPVLILQPGFQMTVEYQSPNGTWYPYSFLQGNNEPSTWISGSNPSNPGLNLTTAWSVYGRNPSPSPTPVTTPYPTILLASPSPTAAPATLWNVTALADAPMFAKADPRSIRYSSQVGVVHITSPTPTATPLAAGIIRAIWPSGFAAPPMMTVGTTPAPTPTVTPTPTGTPNYNPAVYSQFPYLGDNAVAGSNPYSEATPSSNAEGDAVRPIMMNRPFRSVGEMGYAFRDQPFRTLSFSSINSPDAGLLDLFTTVAYGVTPTPSPSPSISPITPTPTVTPRGGVISLNSFQAPALAAVLAGTIAREDTPRVNSSPGQSPSPAPILATVANNTATSLMLAGVLASPSPSPLLNRAALANLIATANPSPSPSLLDVSIPKTQREAIVRALGEVDQTRTWNLLIDVIAQSGKYPPGATQLQDPNDPSKRFIVTGEQRYWIHVAIDRFTGEVLDRKIEVVNEELATRAGLPTTDS